MHFLRVAVPCLFLAAIGCAGIAGSEDGGTLPDGGSKPVVIPNPDGGAPIEMPVPDAGTSETDAGTPPPPPRPARTQPQAVVPGDAFYPRTIRLADGTMMGAVVTPKQGGLGAAILRSDDEGMTFREIGKIDEPTAGGLCCATLYELPKPLGALPAGTLLWSASTGGDTPGAAMRLPVWRSLDKGVTWERLSTVVVASKPRRNGGLWEPEFSQLDDGSLVCHYSDETDGVHSQKLVERRTRDGITWGEQRDTVMMPEGGERPGMPIVRRLRDGRYVMAYEICGRDNCAAYLRHSADGWNWGNVADRGIRPATIDGKYFRHAPTITVTNSPGPSGRILLIGQLTYNSNNTLAAENGNLVMVNTEGGFGRWYGVPSPIAVPNAYNNFCPNYSTTLLPTTDGSAVSIASYYDANMRCRSYYARGPLLGGGDDTGITDGAVHRVQNLTSALCLDVANGLTTAGNPIWQWTCTGNAAQDWTFTKNPNGTYSLKAGISGLCLAVAGGSPEPGANVEQQPCDGSAAQAWKVQHVGGAFYVLGHAGTTGCLDVAAGNSTVGGRVQQWSCNDLAPQIWRVTRR